MMSGPADSMTPFEFSEHLRNEWFRGAASDLSADVGDMTCFAAPDAPSIGPDEIRPFAVRSLENDSVEREARRRTESSKKEPSNATLGSSPSRRPKGRRLVSASMSPPFLLLLCLVGASPARPAEAGSRGAGDGKSICDKADERSLLKQICALKGSSQKMDARFDTVFLAGGSTARLVIGRKYNPDEKLEFRALMIWDLVDHKAPSVTTTELRILSVDNEEQTGNTILTFDVRRVKGKRPYLDAHFMVAAYPQSKAYPTPGAVPLYIVEREATISSQWFAIAASTALMLVLYVVCAYCFGSNKKKWSPVAITAGAKGHGSLSKLQVFLFSFAVVWLLTYILLRTGELSALSPDVLMLLGISAAGTAGSKAAAVNRKRLSSENWSWLVTKGWVKANPVRCDASYRHLLLTGSEFDVSKFQMLAFNLVVAAGLLMSGLTGLANFTIPPALLGLLGVSQVVYLGGKLIPANPYADLKRMITDLCDLESKFIEAAASTWQTNPPEKRTPAETRDLNTAKADALAEYTAYVEAASKLVEVVKHTLEETATPPFSTEPGTPQ